MRAAFSERRQKGGPWIIAHRGASDEAPENTASAFERALVHPIDGIELDVQMSADGVPLLYHDRTLKKVAGTGRRVADFSWKQLQELDAGSWFSPKFSKEKLLSFDKMIGLLAGRTRLFVEIKSRPVDRAAGRWGPLADAVVQRLQAPDMAHRRDGVYIMSFDFNVLERVRAMDPDLPCALILAASDAKRLPRLSQKKQEGLNAFCIALSGVSPETVDWAHNRGKQVFTYTCNGPRQARKALESGADAVITDRPGWLARLLERRGSQ